MNVNKRLAMQMMDEKTLPSFGTSWALAKLQMHETRSCKRRIFKEIQVNRGRRRTTDFNLGRGVENNGKKKKKKAEGLKKK